MPIAISNICNRFFCSRFQKKEFTKVDDIITWIFVFDFEDVTQSSAKEVEKEQIVLNTIKF